MTYSEIKITFVEDFAFGYKINIYNEFSDSEVSTIWTELWVGIRTTTNRISLGEPTDIIGERAAIGFVNAFELDYNFPVQYEVSRVDNIVTIKSKIPTQIFANAEVLDGDEVIEAAEFDITNYEGTIYSLESVDFSEATTPCTKIKVSIETSELTTEILSPFFMLNLVNPFYFEAVRGQSLLMKLKNAEGVVISFPITIPDVLHKDNFILQPTVTPNGGALNIVKNNSYGLEVEYSLDNVNWQEEPYFNGLSNGPKTLYVKDQFGCSFNVAFLINGFGIQDPVFYYSKSNSIRMAERVDFNVIPKNDENTLSCESQVLKPFKQIQLFNPNDNITIQFKSNYTAHEVSVIDEVSNITPIFVNKKTNNIGKKEKRDAIIYRYTKFKAGIYFINGNTYDYDTNAINGTYLLNGLLPVWAKIGNYIVIDSIWYLIENILYVESKNADVLIINKVVVNLFNQQIIVGSVFNTQDYEVYESTVLMANFENKNIRVQIDASDNFFDAKTLLSEEIIVDKNQSGTVEIKYFNIDNNDVFYQTGIQHLLRIPFTKIESYFDSNSENNKTDSTVVSLSSTLYEGNEFIFEPQTTEMYKKLVIALSHKFVFIDRVGYVKDGEIEIEGPLEQSNLYVVKAKMLKTGQVYSNLSVGEIPLVNDPIVEIPGMIEWDGGFIEQ